MLKIPALLMLLTSHAIAAPTIYPTALTSLAEIQNNTNSNIVADTVDEKRVYVMPPIVASATVEGLHSLTANVGFCREMADQQSYSRKLSSKLDQLADQEVAAKGEADALRRKLVTAREEAARFAAQNQLLDLATLDASIDAMELRLTDLYNQANACEASCYQLNLEIAGLVKEKTLLLKDRRELVRVHASSIRDYERRKVAISNLKESLQDLDDSWLKISNRVSQIRNDFLQMYSSFGKMEGARARISFASNWDENLLRLKSENPGFDFQKIPTANAVILANIAQATSLPSDGAILGYEIGGQYVDDKVSLPAYPASLSGNVRLSLIGTCPVLHPEAYDINAPNGTDQMKYGLTISYEYPTMFSVSAKAKYNMYKMYQKIVSSGSSGGFFSSRSWTSVEEKNFFKDSFAVEWDIQDPSVTLPEEQRAAIESEMRKHIFERMATLALPSNPDRAGVINAVAPSQHGSLVLANSLMKTCPGNVYCVGASIALNVLDAIFGNSRVTASYMQTFNTEAVESFSRSQAVMKPMLTVYQ